MKKRIFSIVIAGMILGTIPTLGVSAVSEFGEGTPSTVPSELVSPIISVVVPTDFSFSVDAFEQTDLGTSITSGDYVIINKSNVGIKADVSMFVADTSANKATDPVEFETKRADAKASDLNDTEKKIWMAAVPAFDVTVDSSDLDAIDVAPTYMNASITKFSDYTEATATAITLAVDAEEDATLSFALDKAVYEDADTDPATPDTITGLAVDPKTNTAAFRFVGEANSGAGWAAGDITATITYDIRGLTAAGYTTATTPVAPATTLAANQFIGFGGGAAVTSPTLTVNTTAYTITVNNYPEEATVTFFTSGTYKFYISSTSLKLNSATGTTVGTWNATTHVGTITNATYKASLSGVVTATLSDSTVINEAE